MRMHLGWLIALAGCSESTADNTRFAKPPASGLTVELASVSLADDCAPPPPTSSVPASPPVKPAAPADEAAPSAPARRAPGAVSRGGRYGCDQTTMQLAIKTPSDFKASVVKVKKVELLDTNGKLLQQLSSRTPQLWGAGKYAPWDEKLGAGQTVQAMYALSAPNWNKLTGSRWNAHSKTFQVRVIVEIGGTQKAVTRSAITAVRLPPPVPT